MPEIESGTIQDLAGGVCRSPGAFNVGHKSGYWRVKDTNKDPLAAEASANMLSIVSESGCKGKRFSRNHQMFSKVFFEKVFFSKLP